MTRTMYDGVNTDAAAIGQQAKAGDLVGGYGDGLYTWSDEDWAHIAPGVTRIVIVVFWTTNAGQILDCEPGNCTPAQAVDWVLMRRKAGADPTVYCNQMDQKTGWPAVRAAFQARGVAEPHYWVADYDGVAVIPAGAIGKQHADDIALGKPWDISVVADYWPGVDAPPSPVQDTPIRRNDMHVDLKLNTPVVFTNPAAVLGGTSHLLLASDFGDSTVRVAQLSLKAGGWVITNFNVNRLAGAIKVPMTGDTNKVSVEMTGGNGAVGLDVFA